MTSMHLIMSEEDPHLSEQNSNHSPKADALIKKFHSHQANKILKFNNGKHRIIVNDKQEQNNDKLDGFGQSQVALPNDHYSNRHSQKNLMADTNLVNQAPYYKNEADGPNSKDN